MSDLVQQAALSSWALPFWATSALLAIAFVYFRGWRKIRRSRPELFPTWRLWCFIGGVFSLWIAIASPLDTLDSFLLVAHMTQHLILMSIAPPLLLVAFPAVPLLRGLPPVVVRDGFGPFFRSPTLHRLTRLLIRPAFAWLAMNVAYIGWHLPQAYELALRSPAWHEVEHACFFATSLLFWFPIIQPWPSVSQGSRWLMLPYLVTADLVNTGVSGFLTFSGRVIYPSYSAVPRAFGISALNDQVAAGALMWVIGSILYLAPLMLITVQQLSTPSRRRQSTRILVGRLAAAPSQRFDLLRAPLVGRVLRARYGRMALQAGTFAVALLVIADGFRGPQMGAMNLAGVLPWTYLRALGVIALLVVGNVFCMACPFMLPRELGHRLGFAKFAWPRRLRSKWVAVSLLILFFWSYEAFDLWDRPVRTAWLLILYFTAAFVVDTFFRGASFCKYLCPLGQFNFAASLLAPFSLGVRSTATCNRCATRDCIAGNERQRGCELELYLPRKVGNMDCTLCMDCVKACPHDNIGLLTITPARDLLRDPARSSIRRFSSRPDIAALALVIVGAAFVNAAVMVSPVAYRLHLIGQTVGTRLPVWLVSGTAVVALVALLGGSMLLLHLLGLQLDRRGAARESGPSLQEIFCRLSLALLPLGLGMWVAHLLFHLVSGWKTLKPALFQTAADLGWHFVSRPKWTSTLSAFSQDSLLSLQLLLLDGGLLLTLYLGWRLAQQWRNGHARAVLLLLPWMLGVVVFYAAGVWALLQPMQMRGMMN